MVVTFLFAQTFTHGFSYVGTYAFLLILKLLV